nr:DinI-like family protein [Klebsiella michiganensis]
MKRAGRYFFKDSDREALDAILQEVWEDESWR